MAFLGPIKRLVMPVLRSGIEVANRYSDGLLLRDGHMASKFKILNRSLQSNCQSSLIIPAQVYSFPTLPLATGPAPPRTNIVSATEKLLPPLFDWGPKMAARLIVIRRKKMRKHKLRKLRKRMKFVWEKRDARRAKRREKKFQDEILSRIRHAYKFNAQDWVQQFLAKSNAPLPVPSIPSKPRP